MTDQEKVKILRRTVDLMAQFMRDNPPGNLDIYFQYPGLIERALAGGHNDPKGKRYAHYFSAMAIEQLAKEAEENAKNQVDN